MRPRRAVAAALLLVALVPAAARAASIDVSLRQMDGAALADAVVAAFALDEHAALPPPVAAVMDQRGRRFVPQILPVQTRAKVTFPNSDSVNHHVYSFSQAKRFQIYLRKGAPAQAVVFDKAGVVTLGCNLHDWMLGYVVVLDTPHFTQTDGEGHAVLQNLPAGRYRIEVWHPRISDPATALQRTVTLESAARESWALRLARALLPARDQQPGFADY